MNENTVFYRNFKPEEDKTSILDIQEYENKYNFKLPKDYKEFLLYLNGGSIPCIVKIDNRYMDISNKYLDICNIDDFYPLETADFRIENEDPIIDHYNTYVLPNNLSPIAMDNSGRYEFYIGASEINLGKIYYFDLQTEKDIVLISNSFTEFIEGFELKEAEIDE